MSALSIQVPYQIFADSDGTPLDNGYVWIGTTNLDPRTNPVNVYFDAALTQVAPNPLRTVNGYVYNAGSPSQLYIDGVNFSLRVEDKKSVLVYSFPAGSGISPNASGVVYNPAGIGAVATTVKTELDRQYITVQRFGAVNDGTWISPTAGGTDNLAAFNLALAAAAVLKTNVRVPGGLYYLSAGFTIPRGVKLFGDGETWSAYVISNSATRGTGLLINGQASGDCVKFEENAGHSSIEELSIYNTNTNAIRSIVACVGHLYPRMNRVEICGLRDCSGVGMLLYPSSTGALYETLWGDFNSVKVAGGVYTGLKIQGRAVGSTCNTNNFVGGDIAGRAVALVIDSDVAGADSLNCAFHGTRFEGNYDSGTAPTFVANALNIYGYATTSAYVQPFVNLGYSDATSFFGCYFEGAGYGGSYNDGINGSWPLLGVVKTTTTKTKNTDFANCKFLTSYLYDTGSWTKSSVVGANGNSLDNRIATSSTVRVNAVQSIPPYVFTKMVFGTVLTGNDNLLQWDSTNNYYVCRSPGTYLVSGQVTYAGWATAATGAASRVKTSTGLVFTGDTPGPQGGNTITSKTTCMVNLSVGDTVWFEVFQSQGGAQNTNATATDNYLSIAKI